MIDPVSFKLAICILILIVIIAMHAMIVRLKQGVEVMAQHVASDHIQKMNGFISNMVWRRNVLLGSLALALATVQFSFSGWVLFFSFGFMVNLWVYTGKFLKTLGK